MQSRSKVKVACRTKQKILLLVAAAAPSAVLTEVFQQVPLRDGLTWPSKHFSPVFDLHRSAFRAEQQRADDLVPSNPVPVHDLDEQRRLANLIVRHGKLKFLVEHWIQRLLLDHRLLFLYSLAILQ
jgi:hypothetical protein